MNDSRNAVLLLCRCEHTAKDRKQREATEKLMTEAERASIPTFLLDINKAQEPNTAIDCALATAPPLLLVHQKPCKICDKAGHGQYVTEIIKKRTQSKTLVLQLNKGDDTTRTIREMLVAANPSYLKEKVISSPENARKYLGGNLFKQFEYPDGKLKLNPRHWHDAVTKLDQPGRLRELADMAIAVAPDNLDMLAVEAACALLECRRHWWRYSNPPQRPLLVVWYDGDGELDESDDSVKRLRRYALYQIGENSDQNQKLPFPISGEIVPPTAFYAGQENIDKILGQLLDEHCLAGRPLQFYRSTFFLPLLPKTLPSKPKLHKHLYKPDAEAGGNNRQETEDQADAQAYHYFTPDVRDRLYNLHKTSKGKSTDNGEAVKEWRADPDGESELTLILGSPVLDHNDPLHLLKARITHLRLYRYFNDAYLLAFSMEPHAQRRNWDNTGEVFLDVESGDDPNYTGRLYAGNNTWWRALVLSKPEAWEAIQRQQMEGWLHFTRLARVLFPTFTEQKHEHKIAKLALFESGEPIADDFPESAEYQLKFPEESEISNVVIALFQRFFTEGEKSAVRDALRRYRHLYDDRMFASATYMPSGPALKDERVQRVMGLAMHADRFADAWGAMDGYNYNPEIVKQQLAQQSFRLWEPLGTLYAFSDHVNSWLVAPGDLGRDVIARVHIPHIYERMLIQALLYQASLRWYRHEVSSVSNVLTENKDKKKAMKCVAKLHREFVRFTNIYWFHEVTHQMQGQKIFALQQEALRLQRDYTLIKEQLERTDELTQLEYERDRSELAEKDQKNISMLTWIATFAAISGIWFAFLQVLAVHFKWPMDRLLHNILWNKALAFIHDYESDLMLGLPMLVFALAVLGTVIVRFFKSKPQDESQDTENAGVHQADGIRRS